MALNSVRRWLGLHPTQSGNAADVDDSDTASSSSSDVSSVAVPQQVPHNIRQTSPIRHTIQGFSPSLPVLEGDYAPSLADISYVATLIHERFKYVAVPHLIADILDRAEYWHLSPASAHNGERKVVTEQRHPNGCVCVQTGLLGLPSSEAEDDGEETGGSSLSEDAINTTGNTHSSPRQQLRLRKVIIQVTGRDQGWVTDRDSGCWSWWELVARRPARSQLRVLRARQSGYAGLSLRRMPEGDRALQVPESNSHTDAGEAGVGAGNDDDAEGVELGRKRLCNNPMGGQLPLTQTFTFYTHDSSDAADPALSPAFPSSPLSDPEDESQWEDEAPETSYANEDVNSAVSNGCDAEGCLELIKGLREGDRSQVVARAQFPGWVNQVAAAGMSVYEAGFS